MMSLVYSALEKTRFVLATISSYISSYCCYVFDVICRLSPEALALLIPFSVTSGTYIMPFSKAAAAKGSLGTWLRSEEL
jgi:hypothetical protein